MLWKIDDHPVYTASNPYPTKMDVYPKTFLQIIPSAKRLVQHSSTPPNQQRRPLTSPLYLSFFLTRTKMKNHWLPTMTTSSATWVDQVHLSQICSLLDVKCKVSLEQTSRVRYGCTFCTSGWLSGSISYPLPTSIVPPFPHPKYCIHRSGFYYFFVRQFIYNYNYIIYLLSSSRSFSFFLYILASYSALRRPRNRNS